MAWTKESRHAHRARNLERIREADRERKRQYGGRCRDCGAVTDGSNGAAKAPLYCHLHIGAHLRIWTRETVIAALQDYYATYGECAAGMFGVGTKDTYPPERLAEFKRRRATGHYPTVTSVQDRFGSWSAGLEAAGIPRQYGGQPLDNGRRRRVTAEASERRVCATPSCTTILRLANKDDVCSACDAKRIEAAQTAARIRDEARSGAGLSLLGERRVVVCRIPGCMRTATHGIGAFNRWRDLCDEHHEDERERAAAEQKRPKADPVNGCKIKGCREPIVTASGKLAYLCAEHRRTWVPAKPKKPGSKTGERVNGKKAPPAPTGTRAEIVGRVVSISAELDALEAEMTRLRGQEHELADELANLCRALEAHR